MPDVVRMIVQAEFQHRHRQVGEPDDQPVFVCETKKLFRMEVDDCRRPTYRLACDNKKLLTDNDEIRGASWLGNISALS
jgi:hypothetical protein